MKLALLFLAAGIAVVSMGDACTPSVMCKQHMVEAENTDRQESPDGSCVCIYQHIVDSTGEVHTFNLLC